MASEPWVVAKLERGEFVRAAAAERLLNRELGTGLYTPATLLADAADPTALVLLAGREQLAGAAVGRLLERGDTAYYERFGPAVAELFAGRVGSLEALAVEPAFRHQGLGRLLTVARLGWMREAGCRAAVAVSWLSGRPDASAPVLSGLGFAEGRTVERFYFDESVRDGWACPVCGGPCTCSARLYSLRLDDVPA
jgi:GNAT superfamily N-acetyltransferase